MSSRDGGRQNKAHLTEQRFFCSVFFRFGFVFGQVRAVFFRAFGWLMSASDKCLQVGTIKRRARISIYGLQDVWAGNLAKVIHFAPKTKKFLHIRTFKWHSEEKIWQYYRCMAITTVHAAGNVMKAHSMNSENWHLLKLLPRCNHKARQLS